MKKLSKYCWSGWSAIYRYPRIILSVSGSVGVTRLHTRLLSRRITSVFRINYLGITVEKVPSFFYKLRILCIMLRERLHRGRIWLVNCNLWKTWSILHHIWRNESWWQRFKCVPIRLMVVALRLATSFMRFFYNYTRTVRNAMSYYERHQYYF